MKMNLSLLALSALALVATGAYAQQAHPFVDNRAPWGVNDIYPYETAAENATMNMVSTLNSVIASAPDPEYVPEEKKTRAERNAALLEEQAESEVAAQTQQAQVDAQQEVAQDQAAINQESSNASAPAIAEASATESADSNNTEDALEEAGVDVNGNISEDADAIEGTDIAGEGYIATAASDYRKANIMNYDIDKIRRMLEKKAALGGGAYRNDPSALLIKQRYIDQDILMLIGKRALENDKITYRNNLVDSVGNPLSSLAMRARLSGEGQNAIRGDYASVNTLLRDLMGNSNRTLSTAEIRRLVQLVYDTNL
mgnify:CR=1 FL=1